MDITWTLLVILSTLLLYLYMKFKSYHKYWERKGVAHVKPLPIVGNMLDVLLMKRSNGELYADMYFRFPNEKVVGLYEVFKPVLVIRDTELIEKILVKDFQYFVDHAPIIEEDGLFSKGLFQLRGGVWRSVRYKLSPAFTSGKLKLIFDDMVECTSDMINEVKKNINKDYEIKNAVSNYTLDVMANTVFGIKINDKNARAEFLKMGSEIFDVKPFRFMCILALSLFPKFSKLLGIKFLSKETTQYFLEILKNTFDQRSNGKNQRNDYLQHLIRLKERGSIEIQSKDDEDLYLDLDGKAPLENVEITEHLLYGQAFQFLTAGFEPLYNTIVITLYDMCRFPETQEAARNEIKEVLAKHGKFTYQAVKEMTYLEQCVQETLRMHPLTPFLFRECTKNYITDDGLEIEKGQKIIIPLDGIHMDPKYYPNPEVFKPDRLPPNSIRNNFTYMPFGDGPRMCIGLRFAMVELKLAIAKLLDNFKFSLSPKTKVPFEINKLSFLPVPTTKLLFNITPV
ncbi:hypothetical protein O3M35_007213 [Rhynocoris fuscipes]|uniref:Cytochrome n=1 Tax=Rhynocoris fuscipes TaxID=488301 RepID=A0AAW1D8K1_9HEMI